MERTITTFAFTMLLAAFGVSQTVHNYYVQDFNTQGYDVLEYVTVNVGDEIRFFNGTGGTYNFRIEDANNSPQFIEWGVPNGEEIYSVIIDANYPNYNEITIDENALSTNFVKTLSINKNTASLSELDEGVTIYPNPVQDVMNINSTSPVKELCIVSIDGKIIYEGSGVASMDTSKLNSGVYIVNCTLENNQFFTKKFIKN
jgi:hypothetical protein